MFYSSFFDAEMVGGLYDRTYHASQFAEYFASFIGNGVFPTPGTNLQVVENSPADMNILIDNGLGWINGYFCKNEGSHLLAVQAASGTLSRLDSVVLRWDKASREIMPYVKTGTPSVTPVAPAPERTVDNWELVLATITVAAGATKVTQGNITDKRPDSSVCGWVAGVVQQLDSTGLFDQFTYEFNEWFDDIQSQLDGDIATNLLNKINQLEEKKVNQSDKATDEEALEGLSDTKWLTPRGGNLLAKLYSDPVGTVGNFCKIPSGWVTTSGAAFDPAVWPILASMRNKTVTFEPYWFGAASSFETKLLRMGNYQVSFSTQQGAVPAIRFSTGSGALTNWTQHNLDSSALWQLSDALYHNGNYIFLGRLFDSTTSGPSKYKILWSNSITGPYQQTEVGVLSRYRGMNAYIGYQGGRYWVAADYTVNDESFATFWTANLATPFTRGNYYGDNTNNRHIMGARFSVGGVSYISTSLTNASIGTNIHRLFKTSDGINWVEISTPSLTPAGNDGPWFRTCIYEPISKRYLGFGLNGVILYATTMAGPWSQMNHSSRRDIALVTDSSEFVYRAYYPKQSSYVKIDAYKSMYDLAIGNAPIGSGNMDGGATGQIASQAFFPSLAADNMRPAFSFNAVSNNWKIASPLDVEVGYGPRLPKIASPGDGVSSAVKVG